MAMEYRQTIHDSHPKPVLCIQYNPFRREIYTAGEDTVIKVWESESGKLINLWSQHIGWITNLCYSKEIKVLFSSSIDGNIIAWGSNGNVLQKVNTGAPIYSFAFNTRRQQIMVGQNKKVKLFQIVGEESHGGKDVLEKKSVTCSDHSDFVSCIVSCEGRFYSAGYDRKLVIYDVPHQRDLKLKSTNVIRDAHDASITCMIYGKDADNSWLITGSIDRVVKLWSLDGSLIQRFDGFSDTIRSLCYVVPTQTLWVAASSSVPVIFDPRSGMNVSEFVCIDDERFHPKGGPSAFIFLHFIPETNEVVGLTSRRSVVFWKYNASANLTVLPGHIDIVECLTFNPKEPVLIYSGGDDSVIKKWERLQLNSFMYSQETLQLPKEEIQRREIDESKKTATQNVLDKNKKTGVVSLAYYEELELLVAGYEDSKLRIWGYNEVYLINEDDFGDNLADKFISDDVDVNLPNENVNSRVAGMSLKATFNDHKDAVVALVCFKYEDIFKNGSELYAKEELAADGMILGIEYNADLKQFGYCSSDKAAYIRKFSEIGNQMTLLAVLQGHEADVTHIKWHSYHQQWITGSEDRTIRIWPAQGIPCLRLINNDGPVTALCIDSINGCVITGSPDKIIRVFDLEKKDEIVQKNYGHTDEIRAIIHIPSRSQYISASWDNTVRVWNAYLKKGQKKIAKTATKYVVEEEEQILAYSDLNPLIIPKLLSKPLFVKEFVLEKQVVKEEDPESLAQVEKSALEEELRQTLNELDIALNAPEVF